MIREENYKNLFQSAMEENRKLSNILLEKDTRILRQTKELTLVNKALRKRTNKCRKYRERLVSLGEFSRSNPNNKKNSGPVQLELFSKNPKD